MPEFIEHDDEGMSSIYDTFALLPEREFVYSIAHENGFRKEKVEKWLNSCFLSKRGEHLSYLLDEYFFNRVIEKKLTSKTELLEKSIIYEILNLAFKKQSPLQKIDNSDTPFIRTLKYIEANLFSELTIKTISKQGGISQAGLFREFKKQIQSSPYTYIQNRRLEEAKILLESQNMSVGEVAVLIGYNSFGAFTDAFKRKYKKKPSEYRKK